MEFLEPGIAFGKEIRLIVVIHCLTVAQVEVQIGIGFGNTDPYSRCSRRDIEEIGPVAALLVCRQNETPYSFSGNQNGISRGFGSQRQGNGD